MRFNSLILASVVVLMQANCTAQQIANTLKPRVLYQRELVMCPRDAKEGVGDNQDRIAVLTRLGSELLLNDAINSQILVVDTKSFAETKVPLASPAFDIQIDAETDMLFLETLKTGKDEHPRSNQTCYDNLNALKEQRPRWSSGLFQLDQQIWQLKEHQRFVVVPSYHQNAILLDQNGKKLAEHEVKGSILGVDETDEGFNLFVFLFPNNLTLIQLDERFDAINTRKLPLADVPQNFRERDNAFVGEFRSFRLRGLKAGEVTKYFLTIATQPGYVDMRSHLPIANLPSRFFNVNKLSAAESPLQPEIVVGFSSGRKAAQGFILFDKQSNFYNAPVQQLTDAIFDNERKLLVTLEASEKPRQKTHQTVRLISFE